MITMRTLKKLALSLALSFPLSVLAAGIPVKMYKNPDCGCCDRWAQYLEANGFTVLKINTNDLASIKEKYRIPTNLAGCHTALIEGYVVEGLVARSEEHTSDLQSLIRIPYAVF